ncbi:MAG TPA: CHC2 zinc finger domain-containing protein [Rubrobacter sp.]|nr:CHC2 zinc finger domain-containing protein [Rubrobacter sp.]
MESIADNPRRHTTDIERPERRSASTRSVIEEAKTRVSTVDLADRLCGPGGLRRRGAEWVGRCPLPRHEEKAPSFTTNPEKDVWWCFGCLQGGDVIELARHAWGYSKSEVAMAAGDLLWEFGYERPQSPPAWFRKQERQKPIRDALEDAKVKSAQRRLMRRIEPYLAQIEDDAERRAEAFAVWDDLEVAARLMVGGSS